MFRSLPVRSSPGSRRSRISDREPVQSTRTSPGASAFNAWSASRHSTTRSTVPVARRSIRSVRACSMVFSGTKPGPRSGAAPAGPAPPAAVGQPGLELLRVEDGLDVLRVERVGLVALERVGDEVVRERHHPRPRVAVPLLVQLHPLPVDRLQEGREEQADRAGADHVHRAHRAERVGHRPAPSWVSVAAAGRTTSNTQVAQRPASASSWWSTRATSSSFTAPTTSESIHGSPSK